MSVVSFTPEAIRAYLDDAILHWRAIRDTDAEQLLPTPRRAKPLACVYIDAYQSVRTALFGECLP